jgi:flagellar motor component MotA
MSVYLKFLEALYGITKKMRTEGMLSIAKHLNSPERSPFFSGIVERQPEATFLLDSLHMLIAEVKLDELTFYMDGYRNRLISHDKADVHLVNLVFRTVWAIAHGGWDPVMCTEYGRATIPKEQSMTRKGWVDYCNELEVERTQTNVAWGDMLDEINKIAATRRN